MRQPRKYTREFKEEAVALAKSSGRPLSHIERELGISNGRLADWMRDLERAGEQAFPGQGRLPAAEDELRRLRRENEILRQERDILKKAIAIFTPDVRRNIDS